MSEAGRAEGRANERKRVHWRALILLPDWQAIPTSIVNISESGTCIISPDTRPAGAMMQIVLFVPDLKHDGRVMPWLLKMKVAYSVLSGSGFQLGAQFLQPEAAAVEHIRAAMRR
ncbi:PilZ domain-containing protein [Viridibacterium curvum]|uniref:PilZ domain-containing protein n=1 Tax=Viridibacterium curvum TaxID=1101404 RepID=A0ABP9QUN9_9RHOO